MKKIIISLILVFGMLFGGSVYGIELKKIKNSIPYDSTFLGMKCSIQKYDISNFKKHHNYTGLKDLGVLEYTNTGGIISKEVSYNESNNILNEFLDKYSYLSKNIEQDDNYNYKIIKIGNDFYYVGKEKYDDNKYGIFKNDKLLIETDYIIKGIKNINNKLVYFGKKKDGKNFINFGGEDQITINNYDVENIKLIGNDLYILYSEKGDKNTNTTESNKFYKNFYLYKNKKNYFHIKNMEHLYFGILDNGKIFITYSKFEGRHGGLVINGKLVEERDQFLPYSIIETKNGLFKIYAYQIFEYIFGININGKDYTSGNDNIIFKLSNNKDSLIFLTKNDKPGRVAKEQIYRIKNNIEFKEELEDDSRVEIIKYISDKNVLIGIQKGNILYGYNCIDKNILSKKQLAKQLILSKIKLKNTKYEKFVPKFDKIIPKISDKKLLSVDKKLGKLSEKVRSNEKYKYILNYLEAKVKLEIIKRGLK